MAILIVDDSADSRMIVKRLLRKNGFSDVITAETAFAAFDILGMDRPDCMATHIDLILMDVIMPDMDGIEACRLIKSNRVFKDIPIIVITACDNTETLDRAFAAGAMDFITKPVNPLELKVRVLSALNFKYETDRRKAREAELVKVLEELENANRELSRLSSLDGLTGIANRRHFEEIYDREWRRAVRTGSELAVLFLDLDFFKYYNDTYGHQQGDDCLKQVAEAAGRVLKRPGDLLARYGGEEFVVILPETSLAGAVEVAEAIRNEIERCNIPHSASKVADHVTVSVGVAGGRVTIEDQPSDLITQADKALYEAKKGGRNQVRVANRSV